MLVALFSISFIQNVAIFIYSIRNDLENLVSLLNSKFVQTLNQIVNSEIKPSYAGHICLVKLPFCKSNRHTPIRPNETKPLTHDKPPIRAAPPISLFCQLGNQSESGLLRTCLSSQTTANFE